LILKGKNNNKRNKKKTQECLPTPLPLSTEPFSFLLFLGKGVVVKQKKGEKVFVFPEKS